MKLIKKTLFRVSVVLFLLFILAISNIIVDVFFTQMQEISFSTDKLAYKENIRILQISDVHNKKSADSNIQLVNLAKRAEADIIVLTGDLIDDNTARLDNAYDLIEALVEVNPKIYFVTGNHEWRGGMAEVLKKGLIRRGVTVLDNKMQLITIRNTSFMLSGVEDWTSGKLELDKAIEGINDSFYSILLAHDPWIIHDYKDVMPDLTLSGHTHGGQVRLPFVGAVVAPGQEIFPKLDKGMYKIVDEKFLYIDSGVGTSMFPIRFLNRSQVSLVTIKSSRPDPRKADK